MYSFCCCVVLRNDVAVLIREIELQVYTRLKSGWSSKELKTALLDLIRLARSSYRITAIADLQLAGDIDKALRSQLDKWLIKAQDPVDMPDSTKWLPRAIERRRDMARNWGNLRDRLFPSLSHLYQNESYYVIRHIKQFAKIETEMPGHRHKTEREDLYDYGITFQESDARPATGDPKLDEFAKRYAGYESVREIPQSTRVLIANESFSLRQAGYSFHKIGKAVGIDSATIRDWLLKFSTITSTKGL